jgi:hypothetical protein
LVGSDRGTSSLSFGFQNRSIEKEVTGMDKGRVRLSYQKLVQAQAEYRDACRGAGSEQESWLQHASFRLQLAQKVWKEVSLQWRAEHANSGESAFGNSKSSI